MTCLYSKGDFGRVFTKATWSVSRIRSQPEVTNAMLVSIALKYDRS